MLHALTWLFRGGGAVLIGVATFGYSAASGRDLIIEAVAFAIGAVAVAYWLVADLRPGHRQPRVLAGALIVMAAASGFASMGAHGGPLIGFAFMAAIGAGAGSSLLTGCVTTAIALVGVEAGALVTGASATSALGFPLLLIVAFVSGRNRAAYRRQAEQSAALVTQMEQLRAEQRRAAVLDERTRIAREIHDVLAHSLGALGIQLQAVRAVLTNARRHRPRAEPAGPGPADGQGRPGRNPAGRACAARRHRRTGRGACRPGRYAPQPASRHVSASASAGSRGHCRPRRPLP